MADNNRDNSNHPRQAGMAPKMQEIVSKRVNQQVDRCRQDLEQQWQQMMERMETLKYELKKEILQEIQQELGVDFLGRNEDVNCDGDGQHLRGCGDLKQDGTGQSSCFKALSIVEIRAVVFSHLDVESLKNVRLVSSSWNEQVTPLLAQKTKLDSKYLLIPKFFETSTMFVGGDVPREFFESDVYEIPPVDPRLLKNVIIRSMFEEEEDSEQISNLVPFATKYHYYVEELSYKQFYGIDSALEFFKVLQENDFPVLNKITMDSWIVPGEISDTPIPPMPLPLPLTLPKRNNLECIEIYFLDEDGNTAGNFMKESLQHLINSAPNLKSLSIIGNFFPHFSNGQRIVEFSIKPHLFRQWNSGPHGYDEYHPLFDISLMNSMLEKVSHVHKLKLLWDFSMAESTCHSEANSLLEFPSVMEDLTELNFSQLYVSDSDWGLVFSPERFPRLEKLIIVHLDDHGIYEFDSTSLHVMNSVKTVEIEMQDDMDPDSFEDAEDDKENAKDAPIARLLTKMSTLLPNVTKLVVQYSGKHDFFQTALRVCCQGQDGWKIEKLELYFLSTIPCWSHLLKCLQSLSMQIEDSSVKQLQLGWYDEYLSESELPNHAEEIMKFLLPTKNFQSVIMINMFPNWVNNPIWNRICAFIKENKLPVTFRSVSRG